MGTYQQKYLKDHPKTFSFQVGHELTGKQTDICFEDATEFKLPISLSLGLS